MTGEVVFCRFGEVVVTWAVVVVAMSIIIAARWHALLVIVGVSNGRRLVRFILKYRDFVMSRGELLLSNEWQNEL